MTTFTLRVSPDLSPDGFLRKCWQEWVDDAAYYRAHPEEECPASYLEVPSFDAYVAAIVRDRATEIAEQGSDFGVTFELVEGDA